MYYVNVLIDLWLEKVMRHCEILVTSLPNPNPEPNPNPDPNPNPNISGQVESESEKTGSDPHHCILL
jgi:hypothetical protein